MPSSAIFGHPPDSPTDRLRTPPRRSGPRKQIPVVTIPGFQLRRVVGTGGMGVVYEAHDQRLDRTVAVKLLHSVGLTDPQADERFRFEAQVVARLRHPNVVQPFQFGEVDGAAYLIMEYVDGLNLHAAAGGKPVSAELAATVVRAAAEAVGAAHAAGVVHRDLKPANILIAGSKLSARVQVTDFGMARLMADHPEFSQDGTVAGTPGYMAPEQCVVNGQVGPWTDVYALGVVLYELLTGVLPVPSELAELYIGLVQKTRPVPPRQLARGVPRDLEGIVLKCLAKEPRDRYLTADELAADLGRFAAGRPVAARPAGWARGLWRAARRRPLEAGLAAGLVLALAGGTAAGVALTRQATAAAADAQAAQDQEATARRAAETAAAAARAEAARADHRQWEAANARVEADFVRDLVLDGVLDTLSKAGAGPVGLAALRDVERAAEERLANNPVPLDRVRVLIGQRYKRLGDPAAAERLLRATADHPGDPPNYNQFIALFELADLLMVSGRPAEAARAASRVRACEAAHGWGDPTSRNLRFLWTRAELASGRPAVAAGLAVAELAGPPPEENNPHLRAAWVRLLREATREPAAAAAGAAVGWAP